MQVRRLIHGARMSPHTKQPWMLKGWTPGVDNWSQALDTPAVRQLHHIKALLYAHPYLTRIPDQSLVTTGQGADIFTRIQATRDGTPGRTMRLISWPTSALPRP